MFKNQTGDFSADALQAQCSGANDEYTINIYGNFDGDNNPKDIKTVTYQRINNDTIYHYVIEPISSRIQSCFYTVNGIKSNIVLKFDYPTNDSDNINVGFYDYNWQTQTSQLLYATNILNTNSGVSNNPFYAARTSNSGWKLTQLVSALIATDIIVVGLGGTTTALLSTATAATLAAALAPVIGAVAVAASIGVILYTFTSEAGASEVSPADVPYPFNTPINNPVPTSLNPTPNLQSSGCSNTTITFNASMDASGTISISGVNGGVAPYLYYVNDVSQSNPIFNGNYPDGNYTLTVKDANNCLRSQQYNLARPSNNFTQVTIGNQIWSIRNLDVTTYRDATPIPQVTDPTQWANLTTGAWCYYNNDPANNATYGKFYNWFAVAGIYDSASLNDPSLRKQFAPQGWHVPSDAEWKSLINNLDVTATGGNNIQNTVGGKMKSTGTIQANTGLWQAPNIVATNETGFTGLPGGYYSPYDQSFLSKGSIGIWWSSTRYDNGSAWIRFLNTENAAAIRQLRVLGEALSVRCIKD